MTEKVRRSPARCVVCGALIGSIVLGSGLVAADEPHTHVELPTDGTFFIASLQPSVTTTATAVLSLGDWRELFEVRA